MAPPSLITPPHRPASIAWLVLGQDDCPGDDHWLGPAERDTVAAMAVARRRRDWRLGRWTAKRAIFAHSAELGQLAASRHATGFGRLEIRSAADGAPQAFFDGTPAPVSLSISHRAGRALCAVAAPGLAIGCDLELIEPRSAAFVRDFFTAEECSWVEAAPADQRALLANLIWSAKESALKVLRVGLGRDTRTVIADIPGPVTRSDWFSLSIWDRQSQCRFSGHGLIRDGFVLTVAADRTIGRPHEAGSRRRA